jgi:prephenate dehydrogenase
VIVLYNSLNKNYHDKMKIGIIGGTSGLGETLAIILKKNDFKIAISGTNHDKGRDIALKIGVTYIEDNNDLASSSNIVIVSVPIDRTGDVIKEVAQYMEEGSLMIDVTSIKEEPSFLMEKYLPKNVEYIPSHPIFGPRTFNLDNQVIVLTPNEKGKWYSKVLKFLKNQNMRVIETTAKKHDEMMSIVQVLTHFSYISTASAIEKLKVNIKETENFESPIYKLMIDMIARIVSQNPYLTYFIQSKNSNGNNVRSIFAESVLELKEVILNKEEDKFIEIANKATKNMGDIKSALGRSDKAIIALNHEFKLLQKSIGNEVGLKDIYSDKTYFGILKEVNNKDIFLDSYDDKKIYLNAYHFELLTHEELLQWKIDNLDNKKHNINCVFSNNINIEVISKTIKKIEGIISCKIKDVSNQFNIDKNQTCLNIEIIGFNDSFIKETNDLLKGFSGKII